MREPIALAAVALISVGACTCAQTGKSGVAASGAPAFATPDYDPDDGRPTDDDTLTLRGFGRAAAQPNRSTIVALVKGYLAAAATEDGAKGCAMLTRPLAKSLSVDYGRNGPPYLLGAKTCNTVLSRLFKHEHRQLAAEDRVLQVTDVRVEGNEAYAFLRTGKGPERQLALRLVGGRWKSAVFLDGPIIKVP